MTSSLSLLDHSNCWSSVTVGVVSKLPHLCSCSKQHDCIVIEIVFTTKDCFGWHNKLKTHKKQTNKVLTCVLDGYVILLSCSDGHLPFEHLLVWATCPFEHLYGWATFNCAIKMPNTIACLTGYPQDMCVAIATHGPQACTLSLCSVPATSRWCSLKVAQQYQCSMIHTKVLNSTQKLLNRTSPICSTCHLLDLSCISATVRTW